MRRESDLIIMTLAEAATCVRPGDIDWARVDAAAASEEPSDDPDSPPITAEDWACAGSWHEHMAAIAQGKA